MTRELLTVVLDRRGRLRVPPELREALCLRPGDTFAVERRENELRFARVADPPDLGPVARAVLAEEDADPGRTVEEIAAELGIDLNAPDDDE